MADDDESLDDILSSSSPEPESPEAEQPAQPNRDEHGRFAPRQEQEAEQPIEGEQPEGAEPEPEHNAPVAAVIAERRKAQAATAERDDLARQLAELRGQVSILTQQRQHATPQPQPEPKPRPQLWDDPDQWGQSLIEERISPIQQQIANMTFRASRAEALVEFGKDTVKAAEDAVKAAVQSGQLDGQAVKAQLTRSSDPVGDVVRWHQNSPAVQEATLRDKHRAELMAELGIDPSKPNPSPPSPRNPVVKMPPSLNRIPAGHSVPERDESLDEVLSIPRRAARAG